MTFKSVFSDLSEFPFKAEVWGNFADWITSLASVLMLLVAYFALTTWRKEKEYDLQIEAKGNSLRALDLIFKFTTVPILPEMLVGDFNERYNNLYQISPDQASCFLENFLFEQIRQDNMKTYIELQTLGERLKFTFSKSKEIKEIRINEFYQKFHNACLTISINAFDLSELREKKYNSKEFDVHNLDKLDAFFHKGGLAEISKSLQELYLKLNQ